MWIELALSLLAAADQPNHSCKANPNLVGKCFVVRGRLRAYNGNPTFRIWPVGTTRLLGVTGEHPGEDPIMPDNLGVTFDHDLYADFEVCPFTRDTPGVMRRVCIESATQKKMAADRLRSRDCQGAVVGARNLRGSERRSVAQIAFSAHPYSGIATLAIFRISLNSDPVHSQKYDVHSPSSGHPRATRSRLSGL